MVRWEDYFVPSIDERDLLAEAELDSVFGVLEALLADGKKTRALEKDFVDYIYNSAALTVFNNPALKLVAQLGISASQFMEECAKVAQDAYDVEADKLSDKFEKKIDRMKVKLSREERELAEDEAELSARKLEEFAKHGENLLRLFSGSRSRSGVSSSLTKRRMTAKAKADVEEYLDAIADFKEDLQELQAEMEEALEKLNEKWADVVDEVEERRITPLKKNISVDLFGVAWQPYWQDEIDGEAVELLAYSDK